MCGLKLSKRLVAQMLKPWPAIGLAGDLQQIADKPWGHGLAAPKERAPDRASEALPTSTPSYQAFGASSCLTRSAISAGKVSAVIRRRKTGMLKSSGMSNCLAR